MAVCSCIDEPELFESMLYNYWFPLVVHLVLLFSTSHSYSHEMLVGQTQNRCYFVSGIQKTVPEHDYKAWGIGEALLLERGSGSL